MRASSPPDTPIRRDTGFDSVIGSGVNDCLDIEDSNRLAVGVGSIPEFSTSHGAEMGAWSVVVLPARTLFVGLSDRTMAEIRAVIAVQLHKVSIFAVGERHDPAIPGDTLDENWLFAGALPAR